MLIYHEAPKSLNAGGAGSRRHWSVAAREKQRWESVYRGLLLERNVPKGMDHCTADILIQWKQRRRRDATNYIAPVIKPLADVLAPPDRIQGPLRGVRIDNPAPRWLPDDTDEFFEFGRIRFEYPEWEHPDPRVKAILRVRLEARYPESHPARLGVPDVA